jgi:Immunity protein 26
VTEYPFTPKTNSRLRAGQFWSIPLRDGRFGCGRVLRVDRGSGSGARTRFLAGLLDWVGREPPTAESIAGAALLEAGYAHVRSIAYGGGAVLGERPLEADLLQLNRTDLLGGPIHEYEHAA